LLVSLLLSG